MSLTAHTVDVSPQVTTNRNLYVDNETLLKELNDEMRHAVLGVTIFVGIEVFLAFFGNLLVLYVFLFRYHHCNFRYFVLCLAVTDITSSLTTMPGEMVTQLYWYMYPVPEICKTKSFFNVFTVASEALCLLTIGIDRYLKVCRPLGRQMKPQHAKYLCGVIFLAAAVLATPVAFFWGTHTSQKVYKNTPITVTVCEKDGKWLNTSHPLQYSVGIEVVLSLCLVIMFVLYVLIARVLLLHKNDRLSTYSIKPSSPSMSSASEMTHPVETKAKTEISESNNHSLTDGGLETQTKHGHGPIMTNQDKIIDNGDTHNDEIGVKSQREIPGWRKGHHDSLGKHGEQQHQTRNQRNSQDGTTSGHGHRMESRVRRKTIIMFILTVVFIITTIMYLTLLSYIAKSILDTLSDSGKAVYFFFFRLYFINHVINPMVYGILDPQFRKVMGNIKKLTATGTETSNVS